MFTRYLSYLQEIHMVGLWPTRRRSTIMPPWIIRELYEKFNGRYEVEKGKCLFFSRQDATYRLLVNEEDVLTRLKGSGIDVKAVKGSLMTMEEQIKEVNTSETVIVMSGTHGAHLMFTNKNVKNLICIGTTLT